MKMEEFWKFNEELPEEEAASVLFGRLIKQDPESIIEYSRIFHQKFSEAYIWDLWGAAYLIDGGCSDDGFMDFRYGLISRGQKVYEDALRNPDSLASVLDEDSFIPNEDFGYVAQKAYEHLTGNEMPLFEYDHPQEPSGDDWDFDESELCKNKFPKLWAKFGN